MKKFLLLTMIVFVLTLSSCTGFRQEKPNLDLEEAAEALEDAGYYVIYDDEESYEIGYAEYLEAYDDDEKIVICECLDVKIAKIFYNFFKTQYDAEIKALKVRIEAMEYMLEEYKSDMDSDEKSELKDDIKDYKEELEILESISIGRKGKFVWIATPEAIEDSFD